MAYSTIRYESDDRVAWITLNRPDKMNAISIKVSAEFRDALAVAERDPDVRVVVVKGAGGRAFSSGGDFVDEEYGGDYGKSLNSSMKLCSSVFECSKPVIAMIEGWCLGAGIEFALMCDMRYCSEDSRFGAIEARIGTLMATAPMMPYLTGLRCRELIYTGDMFDAQEAYRLGIVNRVYPKDRLEEEVTRIAKRISRGSLAILRWHKKVLNNTLLAAGFDSALQYGVASGFASRSEPSEFAHFSELLKSEGVAAALKWRDSLFAPFEVGVPWKPKAPEQPAKAKHRGETSQ
ncbi:enoyl-CoA hydratase/isomerase family protein [Bradyrhizobium japonicum]|uniref:enoyl-CoA hydratase/isomerase family protein n=1 Tax=Bradyrhizobium japonicum TaxID=375 RepID=UPI0012FD9F84|nr:enoyl-CoA hydratase/isomerase family protein [Bradyrhizobium japonicum]